MKIINYSFITSNNFNIDHPDCVKEMLDNDFNPFVSLSKSIFKSRKGSDFLKCPAHTDFLQNTFIFCAPFDLHIDIKIDLEKNSYNIFCENISQELFDTIVDVRFFKDFKKYPLLGIDWLVVLTAEEQTLVQIMPAFMNYNDFTDKTTIIPGEYDISAWTRPVETVFEIKNNSQKIIIKKGDAISYFKFLSPEKIKLVNTKTPWEEIINCNKIVSNDRYRPLKDRYKSLEIVRQNKCPYSKD